MASSSIGQPELSLYSKLSELTAIGQGGFGRVYKARHENFGVVAYKELLVRFINTKDRVAKELKQEVSVHMKLRHPNIVTLLAMIFEADHYGVVLEFAAYGDIYAFFNTFPVDWAWKLSLAYDIALGMNYLHTQPERALIHGDLKVKNILVGDGFKAKISDFGLARWKQYSYEVTHTASPGGTVTHIPPESWHNINTRRTEKHDVYSYGVLIWELLAHPRRPFQSMTGSDIKAAVLSGRRPEFSEIPSAVPAFLTEIVSLCWAQDPNSRPMFSGVKDQLLVHIDRCRSSVDAAKAKLQHHESVRMQPQTGHLMAGDINAFAGQPRAAASDGIDFVSVKTSSFGAQQVVDESFNFQSRPGQSFRDFTNPRRWDVSMGGAGGFAGGAEAAYNIGDSVRTNPGPVEVFDYDFSQSVRNFGQSGGANQWPFAGTGVGAAGQQRDVYNPVLPSGPLSTVRESMDTDNDSFQQTASGAAASLSIPRQVSANASSSSGPGVPDVADVAMSDAA